MKVKMLCLVAVLTTLFSISSAHVTVADNTLDIRGNMYTDPMVVVEQARRQAHALSTSLKHLNVELVKDLSSLDAKTMIRAALPNAYGLSSSCANALLFAAENLEDLTALRYFDSWGIVGSGVFNGHSRFPGSYDECKNVSVTRPINSTLLSTDFTTSYCTGNIPLMPGLINLEMGLCMPRQCSAEDVSNFYNSTMSIFINGISLHGVEVSVKCQDEDYTLDSGRIVALVVVFLMIGLTVVATAYDGILQLIRNRNMSLKATKSAEETAEETPLLPVPVKSAKIDTQHGRLTKSILAFSLYTNSRTLLNADQPPGVITCLNGIRFFSMSWVILGHTIIFYSRSHLNNLVFVEELSNNFASQVVINATVSVDTFFILSGLLVSYLFLKDFNKRKLQLKGFLKALPVIYLHRYFRLTPAYGFMILISGSLSWFLWDGPFWPTPNPYRTLDQHCIKNWYLNLLYVNNLFEVNNQCAGWGWYLANDMQFFLIAPFIVYAFYRSSYIGMLVCAGTILGSIGAALGVSHQQKTTFTISTLAVNDFNTTLPKFDLPYYSVPWTRYQTYGIGLFAGFLIYKFKNMGLKIPTILNLGLWGVSACLCMAVVYGPYDANMGYHVVELAEADLYNGFARSAWAIGISYVIISCSLGQGGWVNDFLSWKGFIPLSRLTYCAYLIHIPIMTVLANGARNGTYYTYVTLTTDIILITTLAYLVAFPFSLLFEVPFINLDKLFLAPKSLKKDRHAEEPPPKYVQSEDFRTST